VEKNNLRKFSKHNKNSNIIMARVTLFLLLATISFSTWNCGNTGSEAIEGTQISGTIEGASDVQLFIDRSGLTNTSEVIGKTDIDGNGRFEVSFPEGLSEGIYRLRIGAQKAFLPFTGKEKKVEVNGKLENFGKYDFEVTGSESAAFYASTLRAFYKQEITKEDIKAKIESAQDPFAAMQLAFATQGGLNAATIDMHKSLSQKMSTAYPESSYSKDYAQLLQQAEQQIAMQKASQTIQVGMPAPDIELTDPDGKVRRLSDLKGKVVLLDFWASWCGPCRRANPHVVEIYNKYKSQGFEVYSVSLDGINPRLLPRLNEEQKSEQIDKAKQKWLAAIEKDKLSWPNHVSDLQHWNSPVAKLYGVRGIPRTFLVDREGIIANAGINPLRDDVEGAIKALL
jgi:thiol-disulfide isomerase/thioredoxin